jgi:hypothetical protein
LISITQSDRFHRPAGQNWRFSSLEGRPRSAPQATRADLPQRSRVRREAL